MAEKVETPGMPRKVGIADGGIVPLAEMVFLTFGLAFNRFLSIATLCFAAAALYAIIPSNEPVAMLGLRTPSRRDYQESHGSVRF